VSESAADSIPCSAEPLGRCDLRPAQYAQRVRALADLRKRLSLFPQRLPLYLAAFTNELRARDVTTLLAAEANGVVGAGLEIPVPAVSASVENILVLRDVELHRLVSVLKVRQSAYDTAIREFVITERGMHPRPSRIAARPGRADERRRPGGAGPRFRASFPSPSVCWSSWRSSSPLPRADRRPRTKAGRLSGCRPRLAAYDP
jgi:hypothetical protein